MAKNAEPFNALINPTRPKRKMKQTEQFTVNHLMGYQKQNYHIRKKTKKAEALQRKKKERKIKKNNEKKKGSKILHKK